MTARELFEHFDSQGLADVNIYLQHKDDRDSYVNSTIGDDRDGWGFDMRVIEEAGEIVIFV